jgi:hypothetical protein
MGILLGIILLTLSGWAVFALFRRLRRQHVSPGWWVAFGILIISGVALGTWCALYCEYQVGTHYRIGSFPIPVVIFHLEDGDWVDFPLSKFQMWSAVFTNIITIIGLATLPLWLASWRQHRNEKRVV